MLENMEIAMENAPIPQRWLNRLLISRQESLEAWKKLKLPRAELWLAGYPHEEIKPYLVDLAANVRVLGFLYERPDRLHPAR